MKKIWNTRTDLITEQEDQKKNEKTYEIDGISVTKSLMNGTYYTIRFEDLSNVLERKNLIHALTKTFSELFQQLNLSFESSCLVVGLGNRESTPDSLGPIVLQNLIVTKYLFDQNTITMLDKYRNVSSFAPNVTGVTGLETIELIKSVITTFHPDFVIAIDALASSKIENILKVIQITDTGIHPGSGVGNNRGELSSNTLGIPVIAIGVPTVIDGVTIVYDTIRYLYQKISYTKKNFKKEKLSLFSNYHHKYQDELSEDEKSQLLGSVGTLTEGDLKQLLKEVLVDENLIVSPKEIDFDISKLGNILSDALNKSLHRL
ncbi:MAG: GPR endopeptidase [Firmicutes bacterium]|nr:GPR endopeptidase [Bacillota bacterium]